MQKQKLSKRGNISLGALPGIAITLVIVAAVFLGGFLAVDALSDSVETNSSAANATEDVETTMSNVTGFLPIVGTLIGVGLLLGVIGLAFAFGRDRGFF